MLTQKSENYWMGFWTGIGIGMLFILAVFAWYFYVGFGVAGDKLLDLLMAGKFFSPYILYIA